MRLGDVKVGQKCVIVDSGRPCIHQFRDYTEVTVLGTKKGSFNTYVVVIDAEATIQTVRPEDIELL